MKKNFFLLSLILTISLIAQEYSKFVEDEIIIKVDKPFKERYQLNEIIKTDKSWFNKFSEKYRILELVPIFKGSKGEMQNYYKIKFGEKGKIDELIENMKQEKSVIKASKNKIGEFFSNDTYFSQQWALNKIQAEQAWNINSGSPNVILAILDSGVDLGNPDSESPVNPHPDLADNLLNYKNLYGINLVILDEPPFDVYSHGTHVAGIAGAVTNNGTGISGGGYTGNGINLLIIKVGDFEPVEDKVCTAIYEAVKNGAKVINCSFGFTERLNCLGEDVAESMANYSALLDVVNYAISNDVVIVAGLGNNTGLIDECLENYKQYFVYPASYSSVISVASTDENDFKSSSQILAVNAISVPQVKIFYQLFQDIWIL